MGELTGRGFEARLVWGLEEREAALSDPGLARWCRCVVVAGGDGSIGAVINEMGRAGVLPKALPGGPGVLPEGSSRVNPGAGVVALGTLPMGNENLFAKHYGFTGDVVALADAIEAGRTRRVDLGRVTSPGEDSQGHLFTLMAGVGFDAEVVHRMDRWRSTHKGLRRVSRASYLPRVVSSAWGYRYPRLTVEADGQEIIGTHLFVFNLPEYGGGLRLAPPGCCGDDGLLDWVMFDRPGVLALVGCACSVLRGRHLERGDVRHGRARGLTIQAVSDAAVAAPDAPPDFPPDTPAALPRVQVDGDPAGVLPVCVRVDERVQLELLIT